MNSIADIRVLVVGLGSVGRRHIENLFLLGLSRVEGCSEWRRLTEFWVDGNPLRIFQDYDAALDAEPNAVVIANPTSLHAKYAARAIERGCHVYVEKPLGVSAREALPLVELARERKVTTAVGYQLHFNRCLERLDKLLNEGSLGQVIHVQLNMGEYLPDYHPDEDYRAGYAARSALGGGVLLTQIHDINYLHRLFVPFDTVYAIGGKTSRLEIDVEDSVSFLLRAVSGVGVFVHMDFLQHPRRRELAIIGEEASIFWNYYNNSLRLVSAERVETEVGPDIPLDRNRMYLDAMSDFIRCIAEGGVPRSTLADAIADLLLVDAVRASFTNNTLVRILNDANIA